MKLFKKAKRGFTLVELVVVIAVIAILAAVSVGAYFGITESANSSRLEQEAKAAHTNIQLVAMNQDDNSNLTREGLYINDLDTFETKMESYSGFHYDIVPQEPSAVNNPTLYFCNETGVSSANIVNQRFNTFKYYNPEVGNKRASVNISSGDITIEEATFGLGDPEPIIISSINFENIDDSNSIFVGDRKTFNVITEPAGLGYTFEIGNEDVIKIEGNEIVGVGAGTSVVTVKSENKDLDGNHLTDEITVNVTAVTAVELIVNNFTNNYIENTLIDTDVTYQLELNNNDTVDILNNEVTISHNTATLGLTSVKFSYSGIYGEIEKDIAITVNVRTLQSISADTLLIDTSNYFENDTLDISDIKFTAHYNNNETKDITNLISYEEKLSAGQEKVTISYEDQILNINFSHVIPAIELIGLKCEAIGGILPTYNVGDKPSTENLRFTAFYNNSEDGIEISAENIKVETSNITAETKFVEFSYTEKGIKETTSINVSVTDFQTYYFIDQSWWSPDGATPYINLYDENQNPISTDGIGTKMNIIANTLSPLTVSQIYTINVDVLGAKYIQIIRGDKNENPINAKTVKIDIKSMTGNAIVLTTNATWYDQSGEAAVTFENYDENYHRNIHIVGLGNEWNHSENSQFVYNKENNTYYKNSVNLEYGDEFLFKQLNGDGTNENFNSLIKYDDLNNKITNDDFGLYKDETFGNFKVGHSAAGVYDITINSNRTITFTKQGENFDIELRGILEGVDRWTSNPIPATSRHDNTFTFENVSLHEGDQFRVYASKYENFEYTFTNINVNENNRFVDYYGNIKLVNVDGIFTITVDISTNKIDIDEITSEHVHRYWGHICKNCGSSEPGYLFLRPGVKWDSYGARFAAYFFGNGDTWVDMTDENTDGIYEVEIPKTKTYSSVIFCRMNPSDASNNWDNCRTQTIDLTISSNNNCYTIPDDASTDKTIKASGNWSKI